MVNEAIVFISQANIQRREKIKGDIKLNREINSKTGQLETNRHTPIVGTKYGFYTYAANFEVPFFTFMKTSWLQLLRLFFGFLSMYFIAEQIYLGPADSTVLLANFNLWGMIGTAATMLFQYKSSNYEVAKARAAEQGLDVAVMYPYSTWYKRNALRTLEGSTAINFITLLAFWVFIFPNTG